MANVILYVLLFIALFYLFRGLFGYEYPEIASVKNIAIKFGLPITSALVMFVIMTPFLMSPLNGAIMAIIGWLLPKIIQENRRFKRLKENRKHAQNLTTTAAGLFGGGMVTSKAFQYLAERYPEPFGSEFKAMNTRKRLDASISYPDMLEEIADKYSLPEIRAKAKIIAAADKSGGTSSTARGLQRLGKALRLRNELIQERIEGTKEPKIATMLTLSIIGAGILLDATYLREYFSDGGPMVLSFSSFLFVLIALVGIRAMKMDDIK